MTSSATDDRAEFEAANRRAAAAMAADEDLQRKALDVVIEADRHGYSYQWTWLGLPIIQMPPDIVATQEVIWATRPQLIIETGVARGGSVILSSSLLELIGEGEVVAIDIDIRAHNRQAIEQHPLSHRVTLVEGSSLDPAVIDQVRARAEGVERVMVVLDSNHTHDHVLAELEAYAPLVSSGQYLVVADTVVERIPTQEHRPRPWGPGDNPETALLAYQQAHPEAGFEPDAHLNAKLLMTSSPGGYLRRS
ncbi:MAG: cmcI [Acidimicrobiales bacterium]|nr:cmcI [Acidimicrobiales bacterium]